MKRGRITESQIVSILKEAAAGAKMKEICRRHGISGTRMTQGFTGPTRVPMRTCTVPCGAQTIHVPDRFRC